MRLRLLILAWALIVANICRGADEKTGIDASMIEVSLVPEKPTILLGEPAYIVFKVKNKTNRDFYLNWGGDYRNRLGRPESFTVSIMGADEKPVPQPDVGKTQGGLGGAQKIAAMGTFEYRLFFPHWATFDAPGHYTIVVKRALDLADSPDKRFTIPAEASAKIEVVAATPDRTGAMIAEFGEAMLDRKSEKADSATYALNTISDERAIPYYLRALETNDEFLWRITLRSLERFNSELAFQGLKKGFELRAVNFKQTASSVALHESIVDYIRNAAAIALSKSAYPGALPYLLGKRADPSAAVRITIVQALGTMSTPESAALLEDMALDVNPRVSGEAEHILAQRAAKK